MQTQLEAAKQMLFGEGGLDVDNVKLYPGTERDVTPEQVAGQVNQALSQIASGDFEVMDVG